jgi:plastocyanin
MEEEVEEEVAEEVPMEEESAMSAKVSIPSGSSTPGCEENDRCFIPSTVVIGVGGTVTWTNDDTAAHTVTSGSAENGPDGMFDSSLLMAGKTFEHTFEEAGEYDYFCVVHPWMTGKVIVE